MSQQLKLTPLESDLWGQRVDEMGLRIEGSPIEPLADRVVRELVVAGIVAFRPRFYVANEWGCPDGQPLIGIPFYLVDPRFHAYEEGFADDLEEDERILMGIRHEVGHAVNYAYKLYADPEWEALFGAFDENYHDDYNPEPFRRRCVSHLPGWYAQKHPDEDFAETFAVWLTPDSSWRQRYPDGLAARKLAYVERTMRRIGSLAPAIEPETMVPDPAELAFTVEEYYEERNRLDAPPVDALGAALDEDLRALFSADGLGTDAASVVRDRRKAIMRSVSDYTGSRLYVAKVLLDAIARRLRELGLRLVHGKETDAMIGLTAMSTVLVRNYLRNGEFISD